MIKYRSRIIEKLSHGKSGSNLVKTNIMQINPPDIITCFGSYKVNRVPELEWSVDTPDGSYRSIRLHFTYSRNGGPIQRVMIDEDSEDWDAVLKSYEKIDTDLCRAQDGESLAFYILSNEMGVIEQVIPDINSPHIVVSQPDETPMPMSLNLGEEPVLYDYTITGISGDGLIPIEEAFIVDSRHIAIPHPCASLDLDALDWRLYPRWYPSNTIVKEDNNIVIYPSENTDEYDFDLFRVMGGVGSTPITINSCVKAVPNKYSCEGTYVVASSKPSGMSPMITFGETGDRQPMTFMESPFPFSANRQSADTSRLVSWPPTNSNIYREGSNWTASYRRNDGPLKTITWHTGTNDIGAHHSVWDAIKELLLDDHGRTAFMLSEFNTTGTYQSIGESPPHVKSGLTSRLHFTMEPPGDFAEGFRHSPYRYSGQTVEIRDRKVRFSDVNAGAVWSENTLTVYPTPYEMVNDYGFDGHCDYYEYLCQFRDQLEVGEPIVIHSCAAVEPADHIRVNTKVILKEPEVEEAPRLMGQGLSAAIKLNDGAIKYFKFDAAGSAQGLHDIHTYLYFLGKTPEFTIPNGDGTVLKINNLYFRSDWSKAVAEISGCSGTERDLEMWMPVGNPMDYEDPNSIPSVSILETPEPYKRESNKATFIKYPVNGYTDLFDLIKYTSGDEHTIYSSAVVPSVIWDRIDDSEGPVDPEPSDGDLSGIEPFTFTNVSKPGTTGITKFDIGMSNTDGYWEIRESGQLIASPNHRADGVGFDSNRDDYKSIVIYNMDGVTRDFEVYVRASTVSVRIESLYTKPGDVELKVTSFGNVSPKMIFRVGNGIVYLPETFPPHITDCEGMFNNGHNIGSDITGWDMSNVTNMAFMFADCRAFNQDISGWDVSNVTQMHSMFWAAYKFNQDLSKWCVTNITSYPNGFASEANAWTQPKPVWGTCPSMPSPIPSDFGDLQPLAFTVSSTSEGLVPGHITAYVSGPNSRWELRESGVVVAKTGYRSDSVQIIAETADNKNIRIFVNPGELKHYALYANAPTIGLAVDTSDSPLGIADVTVTSFGTGAPRVTFDMGYNTLRVPSTLPTSITSCSWMFNGSKRIETDITGWSMSHVTNTEFMFSNAYNFNQDISGWDTGNVVVMNNMFSGASAFNQNISGWNTSKVTDMWAMFNSASVFNQDLSGWNVSLIPEEPRYFKDLANRWTLPKPIWGTNPRGEDGTVSVPDSVDALIFTVTNANTIPALYTNLRIEVGHNGAPWELYENDVLLCSDVLDSYDRVELDIYDERTLVTLVDRGNTTFQYKLFTGSSYVGMSTPGGYNYQTTVDRHIVIDQFSPHVYHYLFRDLALGNLIVPPNLPAVVTNAEDMFRGCTLFNSDISGWDVSNIVNMRGMFYACDAFNNDLSSWNVVAFPVEPYQFADGATAWTLSKPIWGTDGQVSVVRQGLTFETNIVEPINLKVGNPQDNWTLYRDGAIIASASVSHPSVTHTGNSYELNITIQSIDGYSTYVFSTIGTTLDVTTSSAYIGAFNVTAFPETTGTCKFKLPNAALTVPNYLPPNITDVIDMFNDCSKFNSDISLWDVSLITSMTQLFRNCLSFNSELNDWNMSNVTSINGMFIDCHAFNKPLNKWNVGNVTDFGYLFYRTRLFNQNINDWDVSSAINMDSTFWGAENFNQPLSKWSVGNVTNMSEMFTWCKVFNQDLSMWNVERWTSGAPWQFDLNAYVWTLPRPIWGTTGVSIPVVVVPDETSFKFNIQGDSTVNLKLWAASSNWELYRAGILVASDAISPTTGVTWYGDSSELMISIVSTGTDVVDYVLMGSAMNLDVMGGVYPNAVFNVTDLSVNFDVVSLQLNEIVLTVPEQLPTGITNMSYMFTGSKAFNQDISGWDTSRVTEMEATFSGCISFNQDLSGWNVLNIPFKPADFDTDAVAWTLPKPVWGGTGVTDSTWSISDTNAVADNVTISATRRIDGVNYQSYANYIPTSVEVKEDIITEANAPLVSDILNKLFGSVSSWTLDLVNNRIIYN